MFVIYRCTFARVCHGTLHPELMKTCDSSLVVGSQGNYPIGHWMKRLE
ncbi:hypothetical protein RHOER0001_1774 [Rhodococcus erythropolis SK121]|nr:hypothetical protein RHOER0001_1774 [Rhodococcus erythropolis SK121]